MSYSKSGRNLVTSFFLRQKWHPATNTPCVLTGLGAQVKSPLKVCNKHKKPAVHRLGHTPLAVALSAPSLPSPPREPTGSATQRLTDARNGSGVMRVCPCNIIPAIIQHECTVPFANRPHLQRCLRDPLKVYSRARTRTKDGRCTPASSPAHSAPSPAPSSPSPAPSLPQTPTKSVLKSVSATTSYHTLVRRALAWQSTPFLHLRHFRHLRRHLHHLWNPNARYY